MKKRILLISTFVFLGVSFGFAQEQPHNDPLDILANLPRPNVMIMMDTSGSMYYDAMLVGGKAFSVRNENNNGTTNELFALGHSLTKPVRSEYLVDSDNERSRMGQAKKVIQAVAYRYKNINIGLGAFNVHMRLNRLRGHISTNYNQVSHQENAYLYEYQDDQKPAIGQINIPLRRKDRSSGEYSYPYTRRLTSRIDMYKVSDPTDVIWDAENDWTIVRNGKTYQKLDWLQYDVRNSRYEMFDMLTDPDGDFIYRGTYGSPDETHRNKLNQVENIDIFLTDAEMLALRQSTALGEPLQVERYIDSAWGVGIDETITFTYYPAVADLDRDYSCSGAEILVGVQNRWLDDKMTLGVDESENRPFIYAAASDYTANAKYFDASGSLKNRGSLLAVTRTPLGDSMLAAGEYYQNVAMPRDPANNVGDCRGNYIILLTDGYESCGGNPEGVAADLLANLGVKTYVIGFVTSSTQGDAIAYAGGTSEAYTASNGQELLVAFDQIFNSIHSELASPPLPISASEKISSVIDFDTLLIPFFDFPGFYGHMQARKLLKLVVAQKDEDTGDLELDTNGDPIIIEDNLSEDRVLELVNDELDPIQRDPSREIVGIRYDKPKFLWDAGELLSKKTIEPKNPDLTYPHLKADTSDLDGDGDTSEVNVNPAFLAADSRRIYTALDTNDVSTLVEFDSATLLSDANKSMTKYLLGVDTWSDQDTEFLINFTRGKEVQRYSRKTTINGVTFGPGDPIRTGVDADGDNILDDILYADRYWKLGDTNGSSTVVIQPPGREYPQYIDDDHDEVEDYTQFILANQDIPGMVLVGANDGMLHAFSMNGIDANDDGDFDDADEYYPGEEVWAFVLPTMMNKLQKLYYDDPNDADYLSDGQQLTPHQYFADGEITLAIVRARVHEGDTDNDGKDDDPEFRIMIFFGEGRGGNSFWAFDVTDPMVPNPIWTTTDSSMGMTLSRPAIGALEVANTVELDTDSFQYFVFAGSGYDYSQVDGSATVGNSFYKFDINTGDIVDQVSVGDVSGGANIPNAIPSRAILADSDGDFFVERAYFADLDGNIWRWSFTDGSLVNLLEDLVPEADRLIRPIFNSLTFANVFGNNVVMASTGGDSRVYLDEYNSRADYDEQRVYIVADKDSAGKLSIIMNGEIDDNGDYSDVGTTPGIDVPDYMIADGIVSVNSYSEFTEEGSLSRGFQLVVPLYRPDELGLQAIQCISGESFIAVMDVSYGAAGIVSTATGNIFDLGEGRQTGVSYAAGTIITGVGNELKILGSKVARYEAFQDIKSKLKVLSWKEIF